MLLIANGKVSPPNIRLGYECLPRTNPLVSITQKRKIDIVF
jgi:hypothetical protein